jgi:hypothetical protein
MLTAQSYYGRLEQASFGAMQRVEVAIPGLFNYWEFASVLTAAVRSDAKQLTDVPILFTAGTRRTKK